MGKIFFVSSLTRAEDRNSILNYIKEQRIFCSDDAILETIIGEILQNVIRHAYPVTHDGKIFICIINNHFLFIKDFGAGFDIKKLEQEKDFNSEFGGLGIPLIRLMLNKDNIKILSKKNIGTSLLLKFPTELNNKFYGESGLL